MIPKKVYRSIPLIFLVGFLGCSGQRVDLDLTPTPKLGIDIPIELGDVKIIVEEARVRNNYQTHYIMTHAEPPYTFFEAIIAIEGAVDPLEWGKENLKLIYHDQENEIEIARWILVGDDIQYKSGEEFNYRYVYIYKVPLESNFRDFQLQLSDGQKIDLAAIVVFNPAMKAETHNQIPGEFSTLGGGKENLSSGDYATIAGGLQNKAGAVHTSIGGGMMNDASDAYATISGGRENIGSNFYVTVGGGYANTASGRDSTIGGGSRNRAGYHHATVGGGIQNIADSTDSTVAGGSYNHSLEVYATVGGGTRNESSGYTAVIAGGAGNVAGGEHSAILGGLANNATGIYSTIGAGYHNQASGKYATVPGGIQNSASGDYSFAAGRRANVSPTHMGVILFADSTDMNFQSKRDNEFAVRASGGTRFISAVDDIGEPLSGVELAPGSGSWSSLSDQAAKFNFFPVDNHDILDALLNVPISTWSYRSQSPEIRHIGPVAQDFYSAFHVGEDERLISAVDADGVALASIQALYHEFQKKDSQLRDQQEKIVDLEARLMELEKQRSERIYLSQLLSTSNWIGLLILVTTLWIKQKRSNS